MKPKYKDIVLKDVEHYIPTFTNISSWQIDSQYNTGGSRSKKIVTDDNDDIYFYKASKVDKEGEIRYPLEFWSEIVSSKIGQVLGFNILDYNIAYEANDKQPVGCLSKSMVKSDNRLIEGIRYLTGCDESYNPETDKRQYTFQFIARALKEFKLDDSLPKLVELLVFDALISNSDRHQENWGFVSRYNEAINILSKELEIGELSFRDKFLAKILTWIGNYIGNEKFSNIKGKLIYESVFPNEFSPIYDSGCCLGRELTDEKVNQFLKDQQAFDAYINKGRSEVHWEGKKEKLKHYDLLDNLMSDHGMTIKNTIERVSELYNEQLISNIIYRIDENLLDDLNKYILPQNRKELMIKILNLRLEKLQELI